MAEEIDFVNDEIEAEETNPYRPFIASAFPPGAQPIIYETQHGLNDREIEQVRTIVREEIAEAMKQLLDKPPREVVIYPSEYTYKQDGFEQPIDNGGLKPV